MSNNPDFPFFDYFEVHFGADGSILDRAQVEALLTFLKSSGAQKITDLFVFSHGWNNDVPAARSLYHDFFEHVKGVLGGFAALNDRKFAVGAVFWPSKQFGADAGVTPTGEGSGGQGHAAALGRSSTSLADDPQINGQMDLLKDALVDSSAKDTVEQARALLGGLEDTPSRQRRFADLIRSILPQTVEGVTTEDASPAFFKLDGLELFRRLSVPDQSSAATENTGSAAGLGDFFGGIGSGVTHLLNYTTYYMMKERAGTIGRTGVFQVLREIRDDVPTVGLHLLGHSFGARLMTAAVDGRAGQNFIRPQTLSLLQAAFSHNAFGLHFDGVHDGFFRSVVTGGKVAGPTLITCSVKDTAVGIAYPIASRLSGVTAAALGDKNDPFGGLGRNGAQKTPEAVDGNLLEDPGGYRFRAGKLYNLNGDHLISGHMDIGRDDIARAVLTAVGS